MNAANSTWPVTLSMRLAPPTRLGFCGQCLQLDQCFWGKLEAKQPKSNVEQQSAAVHELDPNSIDGAREVR